MIVANTSAIKAEYPHHRETYQTLQAFTKFIQDQSLVNIEASPYFINTEDNAIKFINFGLKRETHGGSGPIIGIFHQNKSISCPWRLMTFIVENDILNAVKSRRKKHKKKTKCRKPSKQNTKYTDGRSYDPKPPDTILGIIDISKVMTREIIPQNIRETHITKIHQWMCKFIPLMSHKLIVKIDGNAAWILYFEFHNKNNQCLYCIADKIDEQKQENKGYKWRLRDKLYNVTQLLHATNLIKSELPTSIRDENRFKSAVNDICRMERIINDVTKREQIFNLDKPWQNVAIFKNNKQVNKRQMKLTITKEEFLDDLNKIHFIKLEPILLFNDKDDNGYNIDGVWRVQTNGNDIAISFKFNKQKTMIMPSGIHLDKERVELMSQLGNPTAHKSKYFDKWKSNINDMSIGNSKDVENGLKAKLQAKIAECDGYKQKIAALESKYNSDLLNQADEETKYDDKKQIKKYLSCVDPVTEIMHRTGKTAMLSNDKSIERNSDKQLNVAAAPYMFSTAKNVVQQPMQQQITTVLPYENLLQSLLQNPPIPPSQLLLLPAATLLSHPLVPTNQLQNAIHYNNITVSQQAQQIATNPNLASQQLYLHGINSGTQQSCL